MALIALSSNKLTATKFVDDLYCFTNGDFNFSILTIREFSLNDERQ